MDKLNVLHIIPYQALIPPRNGGALRSFHFLSELGKGASIDCLVYQPITDIQRSELVLGLEHVRFHNPRNDHGHFLQRVPMIGNALYYRIKRRSWKGPTQSLFLDMAERVISLLKKNEYNFVLYEHIRSMSLSPIVKRYAPSALQILDAHNVDHLLLGPQHPSYAQVLHVESNLSKYVDAFFACSQRDLDQLTVINDSRIPGYVIPNGVDTEHFSFQQTESSTNRKNLIFCGSLDYPPNKEGLLWFLNEVWPSLMKQDNTFKLSIVGRGKSEYLKTFSEQEGINLIGEVPSVIPYYRKALISIIPLFTGSGTRLKVLEAMSLGNSMVSTSKGAEGINYQSGKELLIANTAEEFIVGILHLARNVEFCEKLRRGGRALVEEEYSWDIIGKNLRDILHTKIR